MQTVPSFVRRCQTLRAEAIKCCGHQYREAFGRRMKPVALHKPHRVARAIREARDFDRGAIVHRVRKRGHRKHKPIRPSTRPRREAFVRLRAEGCAGIVFRAKQPSDGAPHFRNIADHDRAGERIKVGERCIDARESARGAFFSGQLKRDGLMHGPEQPVHRNHDGRMPRGGRLRLITERHVGIEEDATVAEVKRGLMRRRDDGAERNRSIDSEGRGCCARRALATHESIGRDRVEGDARRNRRARPRGDARAKKRRATEDRVRAARHGKGEHRAHAGDEAHRPRTEAR